MNYRTIAALAAVGALGLAGCATQPGKISAQSVSTLQYMNHDCDQLVAESNRIERRVQELHAQLKKTADNDAAQMGIGLIVFWPALFFLEGGDGPEAQEYGRLRGERKAIETVAIQNRCGIEFKPLIAEGEAE